MSRAREARRRGDAIAGGGELGRVGYAWVVCSLPEAHIGGRLAGARDRTRLAGFGGGLLARDGDGKWAACERRRLGGRQPTNK